MTRLLLLCIYLTAVSLTPVCGAFAEDWPQWRGHDRCAHHIQQSARSHGDSDRPGLIAGAKALDRSDSGDNEAGALAGELTVDGVSVLCG